MKGLLLLFFRSVFDEFTPSAADRAGSDIAKKIRARQRRIHHSPLSSTVRTTSPRHTNFCRRESGDFGGKHEIDFQLNRGLQ